MSPPLFVRIALFAALGLADPASALAQAAASATATTSAQIVDPVGILSATGGSSAAAASSPTAGVAPISGGAFTLNGPANEVVSVTATLPATVQRIGSGEALPVASVATNASRVLTPAGAAAFDLAGAAPIQGAPGGLYAGVAQVVVNLN